MLRSCTTPICRTMPGHIWCPLSSALSWVICTVLCVTNFGRACLGLNRRSPAGALTAPAFVLQLGRKKYRLQMKGASDNAWVARAAHICAGLSFCCLKLDGTGDRDTFSGEC